MSASMSFSLCLLLLAAHMATASPAAATPAVAPSSSFDDALRDALHRAPGFTDELASYVNFTGPRPHIVLMAGPCRSGTTALSRAIAYTGTTVVYQKIKEALRLVLVERLRGQLSPAEEAYFHVDSTPQESLQLPAGGTGGGRGPPVLVMKETFGGAHPLESFYDPVGVLLRAGWEPHQLTFVAITREPLASFASWVKHWGEASESGHGGASIQQLTDNYRLAMAALEHATATASAAGIKVVSLNYEAFATWDPPAVLATVLSQAGLLQAAGRAQSAAAGWRSQPSFVGGSDSRILMPKGDDHTAYLAHVHHDLLHSAGLQYRRQPTDVLLKLATPAAAAVLEQAVDNGYQSVKRACQAMMTLATAAAPRQASQLPSSRLTPLQEHKGTLATAAAALLLVTASAWPLARGGDAATAVGHGRRSKRRHANNKRGRGGRGRGRGGRGRGRGGRGRGRGGHRRGRGGRWTPPRRTGGHKTSGALGTRSPIQLTPTFEQHGLEPVPLVPLVPPTSHAAVPAGTARQHHATDAQRCVSVKLSLLVVVSACLCSLGLPVAIGMWRYSSFLARQTDAFRASDLYVQSHDLPALAWGVATSFARTTPSIQIIGAQKCGTSSLYDMLLQHPDVTGGVAKESHFIDGRSIFGTAFLPATAHDLPHTAAHWAYRSFFPSWLSSWWHTATTGRPLHVVDATPVTLMLPHAPRVLHAINPDAKLLVVLRNPVERLWSHYRHNVRWGRESGSLAEALDREAALWKRFDDGAEGSVTETMMEASYMHRGMYADQLAAYVSTFGADRIMAIDFDDLRRNPHATMAAVFAFLGLDASASTVNVQPVRANAGSDASAKMPAAQAAAIQAKFAAAGVPETTARILNQTWPLAW